MLLDCPVSSSVPKCWPFCCLFFFFNDTATTEIYTLSLHDALPICVEPCFDFAPVVVCRPVLRELAHRRDRKSTRLNSSHHGISYAVFCLERKRDRKSTRLNSSHHGISYAVFCFKKNNHALARSALAGAASVITVRAHAAASSCIPTCLYASMTALTPPAARIVSFFFNTTGARGCSPFSPPRPFPH